MNQVFSLIAMMSISACSTNPITHRIAPEPEPVLVKWLAPKSEPVIDVATLDFDQLQPVKKNSGNEWQFKLNSLTLSNN